jgi:hypothetical protein
MTLADRIAEWLRILDAPASCEQIARGLRTRTFEVRQALHSDPRFLASERAVGAATTLRYTLSPSERRDGPDGAAKAKRPSQCDRVLALLSNRRWHNAMELYRLGCVAHSRVADLRKRGYVIESRRLGLPGPDAIYEYRLVSGPSAKASASHAAGEVTERPGRTRDLTPALPAEIGSGAGGRSATSSEQLSLVRIA